MGASIPPSVVVNAVQTGPDLVATLPSAFYTRKLTRLSVNGPVGSRFELYNNSITPANLLDSTSRGASNTAEYTNPFPIQRGVIMLARWPAVTGTASCTFHVEVA